MPLSTGGGREKREMTYGTKIADAVAPVSLMASATEANTGFPRCISPAFLGFVPPTTCVPGGSQFDTQLLFSSTKTDHIQLLALHGTWAADVSMALAVPLSPHSRSLLASKTLIDYFCVAIDA